MTLTDQITDYVHAAFSGLWVTSQEPDEAEREIVQHAREQKWKVAIWDVANGLRVPGRSGSGTLDTGVGDPLAALRALPALAERDGTALLLLHNFHAFLKSPEVIQTAFTQLVAGKQQRAFIVVLSALVQIPIELEKLFVVIEHQLPDREQLERIARELTSDKPGDMPKGDDLQRVLDAAAGLTRLEAEGAYALSLTRHDAIVPQAIWELKAQTLKKMWVGAWSTLHGCWRCKLLGMVAIRTSVWGAQRGRCGPLLGLPGRPRCISADEPHAARRSATESRRDAPAMPTVCFAQWIHTLMASRTPGTLMALEAIA